MVVLNSSTDVKEWSTRVKQIFCRLSQIHELSDCGLPNHCVSGSDVVPFLPNFELVKRNNKSNYELLCKRKSLFVDVEVIQFLLTEVLIHPYPRNTAS